MNTRFFSFILIAVLISGCNTINHKEIGSQAIETKLDEKSQLNVIIEREEDNKGIPKGLLKSMASVESGNNPYAVNSSKKSHHFQSKAQAANFINTAINNGRQNLSVGCLQLHYRTHRKHFSSVEDMIDPVNNISYAANLLKNLYDKYGSWEKAIKIYHSGKAHHNSTYYKKVMKKYKKA